MKKALVSTLILSMVLSCGTAFAANRPEAQIHTPTKAELEKVLDINQNTLPTYAWTNIQQVKGDIKEIALDIQGLNAGHNYRTEPVDYDISLGAKGILVVRPYSGPWNWMNFATIRSIDKVLDAVYAKYALAKSTPIVIFGRSMGGVGVLDYLRYGKFKPVAAAMNCPVTNLAYHTTERPDCASTIYRAYGAEAYASKDSVADEVVKHDPMKFVDQLPKIPYLFIAGESDTAVHKNVHSDVYVPLMKSKGYDVTYVEVPQMTHVDLAHHPDAKTTYLDFIAKFAK